MSAPTAPSKPAAISSTQSSATSAPATSTPASTASVTPAPPRMSVLDSTVDSPLPTAVIVIGMAGSGKTTLMQRLLSHLSSASVPHYSLNLDPAVTSLPYTPNIDIRDTVNYKQVMQQYALGPNGAILTSLNLFATRFDQVLSLTDKRTAKLAATPHPLQLVLADTPGQIEIFTWSASGVIISESLASSYPTVLLYVLDTPRCARPETFMSNMLYACSIMYKSQLPFLLVFNKTDIQSHLAAVQWMTDYDAFTAALNSGGGAEGEGGDKGRGGYMSSLTRSMSLVLDEFYRTLSHVGVSAVTGDGISQLVEAIGTERARYYTDFLPGLRAKVERRQREEEERKEKMREKLRRDREEGSTGKRVVLDMKQRTAADGAADEGEEDEEDDGDEAEEQDDAYERRLAEQREKAEYDEWMERLRTNRGRLGEDEQKETER